ncbi:DUF4199 domain-containing protein [Pontibacter ruber]|uniref:DUF4199 domain-containing protein n=1 Tax=Pontibacter ruber TaxID=1343895 RepID=A0ABW5CRS3_9BACT|nr:DUF4199 domain-containing protein [Pontibacter ruber]
MAFTNVSYQKVSLKYGIFVGLAHIVFFLIMRIFGLLHIVELSFFSSIFLIIGIVVAIANFKRARNGDINYFQGLAIGVTVGVVSSTLLALFLVFYISLFDATYLSNLQASSLFPRGLSMIALFALTIVYGTWPGFIIAFVAMQWYKRADHTMPERIR